MQKEIDDIRCICDNKNLTDIANAANSTNQQLKLKDIQEIYRCCTKCKICVPYLNKLLVYKCT